VQTRRETVILMTAIRPCAPRLHRQSRLSAVEGLDLALLVDREYNGMGGRIDVEDPPHP
jgi:hypothetical protein